MYSFNSRVRYSEVCTNKELDFYSIINYFQDCSIFHSEDIGVGLDYLEKHHRLWLMNAWQINVNRFPVFGEDIAVSTWAYDFNTFYGYRNFMIQDANEQVLAVANSVWVYMDTLNNCPARIDDTVTEAYQKEEAYPMEYAPRKILLPKDFSDAPVFSVQRRNLDTNNHVNNGEYIRMAEEYIPENFKATGMRAEYRKSAVLGDEIIPRIHQSDNTLLVVLSDMNYKPYTIIEYTL
ncbi:acyl-[acyl-carrier-protein] thioesterase [Anaerocolumna xylanovorans]|uniref:Acyl-ACP thioesterase n=1 Tax=Anaerocolumna xylanovorans DSM 12503 TaxID=1121345 RepID=A0A1M7YA33_9FIRM|nr:acyl-ACP thioesterase domain-containing protein [Anaerocolumna xylanovorans]SHO49480.1 Acyl-ACP thioesterase [Anaerocolumna xylanovorans DSM 12503]